MATNYNYGHVVLEPATDVYYFFASTISASVARADIATHANFHVVGGETGHSPRVDSGDAFPTTPATLANDIFFFDEDVASGLDWLDTDGTTDLTAATAGDMARYDGTDWIKVVNLVGGGGIGGLPDFFDAPIEDVATIDVSEVTPENYLAIDANNVITNRGGFTIEVGTNTHQAIKVPVDGNYTIAAVTSILQLVSRCSKKPHSLSVRYCSCWRRCACCWQWIVCELWKGHRTSRLRRWKLHCRPTGR